MAYRNRADEIAYIRKRRRTQRAQAIAAKGGKCERCGYSGPALTFHHRDPASKLMKLDVRAFTRSMKVLAPELEKCDLLCANCHIELHVRVESITSDAAAS